MPSGKTHAAVTRMLLGTTDGRDVQRLLDSTASAHGPSHRHDPEHSIPHLAVELAKRGQLTGENVAAGMLHIATDKAFDAMGRAFPSGTPRRIGKMILEDALTRSARRRSR